jgi:hypothetical protein
MEGSKHTRAKDEKPRLTWTTFRQVNHRQPASMTTNGDRKGRLWAKAQCVHRALCEKRKINEVCSSLERREQRGRRRDRIQNEHTTFMFRDTTFEGRLSAMSHTLTVPSMHPVIIHPGALGERCGVRGDIG